MKAHTIVRVSCILLLAASAATPVLASGGGGGGGSGGGGGGGMTTLSNGQASAVDPRYSQGVAEIEAGRFPQAVAALESYIASEPAHAQDADAQNWLGYAYRKSGNLDAAFLHYDKALAINPRHRGAHEYMGEAYLMTGNLAQAEEHLKALDQLCFTPCKEYTQLKQEVASWKVAHAETVGSK
jgi:tetratricopeptide (TPR) repeat protein